MKRRLIINADDFGLTDGICQAIYSLFEADAISSTSLMLAAEGAIDRCRTWKVQRLAGRAGVHLQVTGGRPILPPHLVPSLVESSTGAFREKRELHSLRPAEVESEWRAQIQLATCLLEAAPSHLDSHHGAHHVEPFADVFVKLALEFGLPVRDRTAMREMNPGVALTGSDVVLYEWTATGAGLEGLKAEITRALARSNSYQVLELVTHPGFSGEELRRVSALNDRREHDMTCLLELARSKWLSATGIELVNFATLANNGKRNARS